MKRTLHVHRTYPHPPELVWRALTEPALLAAWLMENDFAPTPGHRFTFRTQPGPGFDGLVHCQVLDLDPPHRMRWSWQGGPIDTVVTFTLAPTRVGALEGTRLEVEQTGFEGLAPVLVSFILGAGNRRLYGHRLPALLDELAGRRSPSLPPHGRGLWWVLSRLFSPILRRSRPSRGRDRPRR
jgi:uncharacterized protein YndB with AHSA1/START domain